MGLKVSNGKTKVMVSSSITGDGLYKINDDPCEVSSLRVKANSVLCLLCGKWIQGRCARMKMVSTKFSRKFTCRKCEGIIGDAVEHEEKLCYEVEKVREFTYLGYRVSAGGGCEAAVTARTRCGLVKFRE